ncbi:hypothetical protein CD30_14645 [Ureibacillus massiliensis 4400831 = CIP 108448 = CCUG 49529]|uniref:Uncharacterized protein n=1 Tax=Ureibacillus massiliensis 4400831 = CIP 108448 = CCUG 49529 TaxID=1211035 RepID=A0A0A3IYY5_9BACL|nr:hypothetical protein CD30_14645 [Ureibacillus massiliensis 4400831 = CIP 108448 = CCUG 49529]
MRAFQMDPEGYVEVQAALSYELKFFVLITITSKVRRFYFSISQRGNRGLLPAILSRASYAV